jgi:hypothetical protein
MTFACDIDPRIAEKSFATPMTSLAPTVPFFRSPQTASPRVCWVSPLIVLSALTPRELISATNWRCWPLRRGLARLYQLQGPH